MEKLKFSVNGMSCAACVAHVERTVSKIDGVKSVSVSLLSNSMAVEFDKPCTPNEIIVAVEKVGFTASLFNRESGNGQSKDAKSQNSELKTLLKRLIVSICILIPLFYISMGYGALSFPLPEFLTAYPLIIAMLQAILCTAILIVNKKFFVNGFKSLFRLSPNMDALIAIGSGASFIYSLVLLFIMAKDATLGIPISLHGLYFEASAMIPVLITVGKCLESYSKGKTTNALKALVNLKPKTATVIVDGVEKTVMADELQVGDIFLVRPGESFPCDGVVLSGESSVDQSMITGESIPVDKTTNDLVTCATINLYGSLTCRATKVGRDTSLSQIIQMVEDSGATKAPIAKIADKVAGVFVPVVMSIALVVLGVWLILGYDIGFSLARAISVLVISCPCALGLATPVAIVVGNGVSAKYGILFKNATALENTAKVDFVVLDKTGTLTTGKPVVTDVITDGISEEQLLTISYALENKSEHPLAKAVCNYCKEKEVTLYDTDNFSSITGKGVKGIIDGVTYYGGNLAFMNQVGATCSITEKAEELSKNGKTPLYFCNGKKVIGVIAVRDQLKPDSAKAVKLLKQTGFKVIMLTGDNKISATAIAREARVDYAFTDLLPDQKAEIVKTLSQYGKVCMVGDGINDAPALTSAQVGVAIGAGTDVAIDSADVVLINSNLLDLVRCINVSARTRRTIHQNLFWAFLYNSIGIPIAGGALIPVGVALSPMIGALAMSLSSVCVVLNSLRLNLMKADKSIVKNKKGLEVPQSLIDAVKKEKIMKKRITVLGMMCLHCKGMVEKILLALDGVSQVEINLDEKTALILGEKLPDDQTIKTAIENAGYQVPEIQNL